jgi:FkbM family methyltransferase
MMKEKLLGNPIGRIAFFLRDKFHLIHTAYFYPEIAGKEANDQLANVLVTRICQSNKTFIDIGAHIGSILSEVLYIDPAIKMIAIEAIPAKVDSLKRRFPSIELHHCALGDFSGEVPFFVNIRESGYSSLSKIASSQVGEIVEITVPIKKLDDLVSSNDVDVIKIDVEGAELNVLRGAITILQKNRPTIMFESVLQLESEFGYTKEELYDFFSSNNVIVQRKCNSY